MQLYKYNCGGSYGTLTFVWKLENIIDQKQQIDVVTKVRTIVPKFEKCFLAKQMRTKYSNITGMTPALRRNLVQYLTGAIPRYIIIW